MKKTKKRAYEKPIIKKQLRMVFPLKIINAANRELSCRQCSSCHGCR